MSRARCAVLIVLFLCAGAVQGSAPKFVSELPSQLKQSGVIDPNITTFQGTIRLNGTFEAIWEPGTEGDAGYFRILFAPNKNGRKILPHDSTRGLVREIWLRNTDKALGSLLSASQRKALIASRSGRATGTATVVLRDYQTGVDCDQRGYSAVLVSVVGHPADVVMNSASRRSDSAC